MDKASILHLLPSVNEVLSTKEVEKLLCDKSRTLVRDVVRMVINQLREQIIAGNLHEIDLSFVVGEVVKAVHEQTRPSLRRVINATGVVLHTNLGRALLCESAGRAVSMAARFYTNLEFNLEAGHRGSRYAAVEGVLTRLTGAEGALVVNNNAAAVLLALSTLASGREVIVSRGQLVEIGGSFRIPEVMAQSGAKLVEVGTTNKTYPDDYRRAINEQTALLLQVHKSNYRIMGFTRETEISELVQLGRKFNLPVMSDLGSGALVDLQPYGLPCEPIVKHVVGAGADVVTFSGDKLLGGPQAGIIIGKRKYIERMKKNPLTRAVRIDKLTLAALEATLRTYLNHEQALLEIPTLKMLTVKAEELEKNALELARLLKRSIEEKANITVEPVFSQVGGGAMPLAELPSYAVVLKPLNVGVEGLSKRLRLGDPAVISRVQDDLLFLDVRTVQEGEHELIVTAIKRALS